MCFVIIHQNPLRGLDHFQLYINQGQPQQPQFGKSKIKEQSKWLDLVAKVNWQWPPIWLPAIQSVENAAVWDKEVALILAEIHKKINSVINIA